MLRFVVCFVVLLSRSWLTLLLFSVDGWLFLFVCPVLGTVLDYPYDHNPSLMAPDG